MNKKIQTYTKGSVTSKDGTTIGYRQMGSGPGVIILHGGGLASQHYITLGTALSDEFTVYIPDRRGRGMSGPFGKDYTIKKEDEDLDALTKKTGAHYVFGNVSFKRKKPSRRTTTFYSYSHPNILRLQAI